jgi:hypothetical protein
LKGGDGSRTTQSQIADDDKDNERIQLEEEEMKKSFIALAITVALILGTYGGVALAAPPGATPLEMWEQILARIGDPTLTTQGWDTVSEALEDIDSSIDGISTDIGNQTTDLTGAIGGIDTKIDGLPTMFSATSHVHSETPQNDFLPVFNSGIARRLFNVSIRIKDINPAYGYVRVTELIGGESYLIGIDGSTEEEMRLDLEFTGEQVIIEYLNSQSGPGPGDAYPIDFSWGVTETAA